MYDLLEPSFVYIYIDRAVGIWHEAGAIAQVVPIYRIRHEAILCISHSQRPECIVGRKAARRKMQDVDVPSGGRTTRAVHMCPPIHRLLRNVHRAGKYLGARSSEKHPIAGHAASINSNPTVGSGKRIGTSATIGSSMEFL